MLLAQYMISLQDDVRGQPGLSLIVPYWVYNRDPSHAPGTLGPS